MCHPGSCFLIISLVPLLSCLTFPSLNVAVLAKCWSHSMLLPCQCPAFVEESVGLVLVDPLFCDAGMEVSVSR